jgi:hypothetical protein
MHDSLDLCGTRVRPVWLQAVIVDLQTAAGHVTIGERDEFHEFLKELASRLPSSSGPIERIIHRGFLVEFACACGKLSTIRRTGSRGSSPAPSRQNKGKKNLYRALKRVTNLTPAAVRQLSNDRLRQMIDSLRTSLVTRPITTVTSRQKITARCQSACL